MSLKRGVLPLDSGRMDEDTAFEAPLDKERGVQETLVGLGRDEVLQLLEEVLELVFKTETAALVIVPERQTLEEGGEAILHGRGRRRVGVAQGTPLGEKLANVSSVVPPRRLQLQTV